MADSSLLRNFATLIPYDDDRDDDNHRLDGEEDINDD